MLEPDSIHFDDEDARLIPLWSIVTAVLAFVLVEYYLWIVLARTRTSTPPPFALRVYFNLSFGLLASVYFLLIGYVSKDAPRRAMSVRFWVVLCFIMPGGIGAVLYFLLRQPVIARCPACSTHVLSEFHFCPQCNYRLTASCGNCFRTVHTTDQFCTQCGHELSRDQLPARLHLLGE